WQPRTSQTGGTRTSAGQKPSIDGTAPHCWMSNALFPPPGWMELAASSQKVSAQGQPRVSSSPMRNQCVDPAKQEVFGMLRPPAGSLSPRAASAMPSPVIRFSVADIGYNRFHQLDMGKQLLHLRTLGLADAASQMRHDQLIFEYSA